MDFTLNIYSLLLKSLLDQGFVFQPFRDFLQQPAEKSIILRHDVDAQPPNALRMALLENKLGIQGTYYFRMVPPVFNEKIICEIAQRGHEIGYHYETMDTCKGNISEAYQEFFFNLEKFRQLYPVQTICMHGSPRSKYDNKLIWSTYHYKDLGIIGEPYFDIDFQKVAYFTDTGRRWNGENVSIRDKVKSNYNFDFKTTYQIIDHIDRLPAKIMLTIHPQRWHNRPLPWLKELVWQNVKNQVKKYMGRKQYLK